jgi:hypothetical protein
MEEVNSVEVCNNGKWRKGTVIDRPTPGYVRVQIRNVNGHEWSGVFPLIPEIIREA